MHHLAYITISIIMKHSIMMQYSITVLIYCHINMYCKSLLCACAMYAHARGCICVCVHTSVYIYAQVSSSLQEYINIYNTGVVHVTNIQGWQFSINIELGKLLFYQRNVCVCVCVCVFTSLCPSGYSHEHKP